MWSRSAFEFFFVLIDHELCNIVASFVIYGVCDVAEFARTYTFIGHCDEDIAVIFHYSQVVHYETVVDCD